MHILLIRCTWFFTLSFHWVFQNHPFWGPGHSKTVSQCPICWRTCCVQCLETHQSRCKFRGKDKGFTEQQILGPLKNEAAVNTKIDSKIYRPWEYLELVTYLLLRESLTITHQNSYNPPTRWRFATQNWPILPVNDMNGNYSILQLWLMHIDNNMLTTINIY